MSKTTIAAGAALLAFALGAGSARAELVELTSGAILQGDVLSGQSTDEGGLALNLYDTNGIVMVKWSHIIESRRRELRLRLGIDLPEETQVLVDGHRVLLVSGEVIVGIAENPRGPEPLRMKTRAGVKPYDRSMLAGPVEETKVPGLLVYTVEELYQRLRDESPPESAAAHKQLAQKCLYIGAYEHAKEHIASAKADTEFLKTDEGKALDAMDRQCDLMIRAKGARDLVTQIGGAVYAERWNDALKLLGQLDEEYKDEQIRKSVSFDFLENKVVKGRDTYFQRKVPFEVFRAMDQLIDQKVRERKPLRDDTASGGGAQPGTLAAARQWAGRELYAQLWEKVGTDLGLSKEELEKYWKTRTVRSVRRANYGTGSFIVIKRSTTPKASSQPDRRRPPGSDRSSGDRNAPSRPQKVEKPKTDEEWWDSLTQSFDRRQWLTAYFVETSGMFDIVRVDEPPCDSCGGLGYTTSSTADGGTEQHFCVQCNAASKFRTVTYK